MTRPAGTRTVAGARIPARPARVGPVHAGALAGSLSTSARNPGLPLDLGWVRSVRVDRGTAERRAAALSARHPVDGESQIAWLLRAVTLIDLTTLRGDDTASRVKRLCARAIRPLRDEMLDALGLRDATPPVRVAAVCVYPAFIETARRALDGSSIPVAAVAAGFPAGLTPLSTRIAEIRASVGMGAAEIDAVIARAHVLEGRWSALYDEVRAFREACGQAHLKVILATGELGTLGAVQRASLVCMMAGADFIKTSTGMETVNATLPAGLAMARAIRSYHARTGAAVGLKPAGGIRRALEALEWLAMVKEELGDPYLCPDRFRFGASALLTDIEERLECLVAGRDAARSGHQRGKGSGRGRSV